MTAETVNDELWGGLSIPIIGACAEKGVGKTLFGLTISPGRTLVNDFEGSCAPYMGVIPKHLYFDCATAMRKKYDGKYTPHDRFMWWQETQRETLRKHPEINCIMIDPVSELEEGVLQYVEKFPDKFNYTREQFNKSTSLKFGAMKTFWKAILDDLRTQVDTVYFTAHMRMQFKGGRPTGKREAKGKETLFELSSLYLELKKEKDSALPSAIVKKSRLSHTKIEGGQIKIVPVLPPRLPVATPDEIRRYIATPADYGDLKDTELAVEESLSQDEKLMLEAKIAEDNAKAAEAKADEAESNRLIEEARKARELEAARKNAEPDQTREAAKEVEESAKGLNPPATESEIAEITRLGKELGLDRDEFVAICKSEGASSLSGMTKSQCSGIGSILYERLSERQAIECEKKKAALGDDPTGMSLGDLKDEPAVDPNSKVPF